MQNKAVFLDRDGTIIREAEYLSDPEKVELLDGSVTGIRQLHDAGYLVVVTSNQSGVARGYFDETAVRRVNAQMQKLLQVQAAQVDAVYFCPHYPQGTVPEYSRACDCRKPAPGMLQTAARELGIDLKQSWVIGDKQADIEFGLQQGLGTILVLTGYGEESRRRGFPPGVEPDYIASNLADAAQFILSTKTRSSDSGH